MKIDELKRRILSRRARFIAAALAASSATACGGETKPTVCLEPVDPSDGSTDAPTDAPVDGTDDVGPQACLKVAPDSGTNDGGEG